ncbi:hypothetical protein HKX48_002461 [Thoreauomyces humboldtii]|nr:hypothetical protein HKX48_002461 [Thoreauomyces humboldtii]
MQKLGLLGVFTRPTPQCPRAAAPPLFSTATANNLKARRPSSFPCPNVSQCQCAGFEPLKADLKNLQSCADAAGRAWSEADKESADMKFYHCEIGDFSAYIADARLSIIVGGATYGYVSPTTPAPASLLPSPQPAAATVAPVAAPVTYTASAVSSPSSTVSPPPGGAGQSAADTTSVSVLFAAVLGGIVLAVV